MVVSSPWPAYLGLGSAEVAARAESARRLPGPGRCGICPRLCKVNRLGDQRGLCAIGRQAAVASHFPHFGEENCLRGRNGSGPIFSGCNLRCVFCQNHDISWQVHGEPLTPRRLAAMMLALQDRGCRNINFVTPEHVVPQILEALPSPLKTGCGCRSSATPAPTPAGQLGADGRHRRHLPARPQGLDIRAWPASKARTASFCKVSRLSALVPSRHRTGCSARLPRNQRAEPTLGRRRIHTSSCCAAADQVGSAVECLVDAQSQQT